MLGLIFADLRRLWLGSLFVSLIVALAVALGVTVILQERAIRVGSARAAEKFDLVIGAPGSETQLVLSSVFLQPSPLPLMSGDILAKLSKDERVAWVAPIGFGDSYGESPIVGTTIPLVENIASGFSEGRIFAKEGEAILGAHTALRLGDTIKPTHGTAETGGHTHTEMAYTAVGRLKETGTAWDRAVLVPIQAVWHIHGMEGGDHDQEDHVGEAAGHDEGEDHDDHEAHPDAPIVEDWQLGEVPGLPALLVKPKNFAGAYKLRQEYRKETSVAVFPAEVLTKLYATLGDAKLVLVAVAYGAQILVAAALLLVTVMHINQRRRQIGALRAFGVPRGALFSIVWLEQFCLLATGIVIGFAGGYAAAQFIATMLRGQSGVRMPVEFASDDVSLAIMLVVASAILAAVPAILAYRQPPASALRAQ